MLIALFYTPYASKLINAEIVWKGIHAVPSKLHLFNSVPYVFQIGFARFFRYFTENKTENVLKLSSSPGKENNCF